MTKSIPYLLAISALLSITGCAVSQNNQNALQQVTSTYGSRNAAATNAANTSTAHKPISATTIATATTTSSAIKSTSNTIPSTTNVPQFSHVVIVLLENRSYNQVVGNPAMPYYNSLVENYGLAENYFANTHPSIGNYLMLTTGAIETHDDNFSGTITNDNLARILTSSGKSWKVYAESLPSVGYVGGNTDLYLKRHNPFAYFSDVITSSTEQKNVVPFTEFANDLANNNLPTFSFIVPNACSDAHDCGLATTDAWLKMNIAPLVNNQTFQQNGLLAIVFDEGKESDKAHGGGQDPALLVGSEVKPGYRSMEFYQHQNLLKTVLVGLGLTDFPGATATATPMVDFFK